MLPPVIRHIRSDVTIPVDIHFFVEGSVAPTGTLKPSPKEITEISYLYRDASNYKATHSLVIAGEITEEEKKAMFAHLDEGEWFIPGQVGLPDIHDRLDGFPDDQDDHVWHELGIDDFAITGRAPTEQVDIHAFAKRFCETKWDVAAQIEKLGLADSQSCMSRY